MFLEARAYLAQSILIPDDGKGIFELNDHERMQLRKRWREVVCETCPHPEEGVIASNVAFIVGRVLDGRGSADRPAPPVIAQALADAMNKDVWFRALVGGPGHVNITPGERFARAFLGAIVSSEGSALLDQNSVIFSTELGAEVTAETMTARSYPIRTVLENIQNSARVAEVKARFESGGDDRGLKIMLLALLSDAGINPSAYLQNLAGRENVPWYLDSFFKQSQIFLHGARGSGLKLTPEGFGNGTEFHELLRYDSKEILAPLLKALFTFRSEFQACCRADLPEAVLALGLNLARQFFALYNRPEFRMFPELPPTPEPGILAGLTPSIIFLVRRCIDLSLEKSNFTKG